MNRGALDAGVTRVLGRRLSRKALDDMAKYVEILVKWQRSTRLVGSAREDWILEEPGDA